MKYIRWFLSVMRIKITKDYGMCCNEEQAIKCAKEFYFGKIAKSA